MMENNLLRCIWRHSRSQQLVVVLLTLLSFPILYFTLELPKWIINDALSGDAIEHSLLGTSLTPVMFLTTLCLLLLGLIILNGVLKMRINTLKGIIGERLIRRLRFNLIRNVLRFPLPYFSQVSSGEIVSSVTSETEPLGGYIGESIALPLFQGGTMITILVFMCVQDWVFGLVSVALIPIQGYLIPKLQTQVNHLKKERVTLVRKLSERIGETVAGAPEIRLHGTQPYTLSEYSKHLGNLFQIRLQIFKKKFFMKFLNNTIGQITPFLFYLFGGYLVIKGDLTIGALVAAIGAYKDLTSPWRELLNFYQLHEDSKIKYQQILELFQPDSLIELDEQKDKSATDRLSENIELRNISWVNDHGERVLSGVNLYIEAGSMIAITGDYPIRRTRLAQIMADLEPATSGTMAIGNIPTTMIPQSVLRRRLSLQGSDPHVFAGTILDNVEYALNKTPPESTDAKASKEAEASGNVAPFDEGWLDYRVAGNETQGRSTDWYQKIIHTMGAQTVVYERSLLETFDPAENPELAAVLLKARHDLRDDLLEMKTSEGISLFNIESFNPNTNILENILFGIATDHRLDSSTFKIDPYLLKVITDQDLKESGMVLGIWSANKLLTMIDNSTIDYELIQHFGLDDEMRVDRIRTTLENNRKKSKLSKECECLLLSLFLLLIPKQHNFIRLDNVLIEKIMVARQKFRANLPETLIASVQYFDTEQYHQHLTVKDNLLFGRVSSNEPATERKVNRLIKNVIDENDLYKDLALLLGDSQVGIGGSRLPTIARHRLSFGRSLMKKPDILIFHDALSPLDVKDQKETRQKVKALLPDVTIIWIARDILDLNEFDQVYEFTEAGPLALVGGTEVSNKVESIPELPAKRSSSAIDLISNSALFSGLMPDQRQYLAGRSSLVTMRSDTVIYESNDRADAAWLVVSGTVETLQKGEVAGTFHRPEVFGSIEVIADSSRILSARTTEDSVLLRIDGVALETIAMSDAMVSRQLLKALSLQWRR